MKRSRNNSGQSSTESSTLSADLWSEFQERFRHLQSEIEAERPRSLQTPSHTMSRDANDVDELEVL